MITKSRAAFWLLLVGGLVWLIHGAGVPLYDGLGFPDEPYRYVKAPQHDPHGPPAAGASNSAPVVAATNRQLGLQTVEQAPQIALVLPSGALTTPAGATRVTATATPLAPEGATPYGPINGNIYRVAITSDAGPVTFAAGAERAPMVLRATQQFPPDTVGLFRPTPEADWMQIPSGMAGFNIYSVEFHGNGDYALAQPVTTSGAANGGGTSGRPDAQATGQNTRNTVAQVLVIAAGFVVLVLVIAIVARWRSTASGPPPQRRQLERGENRPPTTSRSGNPRDREFT